MINSIQNYSLYNMNSLSSLSNTLLSGSSSLNTMKLNQALLGSNYSVNSVSGLSSLSTTASSDTTDFVKTYRSLMSEMSTAASRVMSPVADRFAAGSSDTAVASASGKISGTGDSYTISVGQLASGQINRSVSMESGATLPSMSGSLRITTESGTKELYLSSAGAKTNADALQKFADKINASGAGVTAKTVEKDDSVFLELEGSGSDFLVSGSLADSLSLNTIVQESKDAVYSVSKNGAAAKQMTSSTNNITLTGGLTAKLEGLGTATISAGQSRTDAMADAMEGLVSSFNSALSFLNKNADRGIGVLQQMKRMVTPPYSERSMALAGVTTLKDGSLSFDRAKFTEEMGKSPSLISNIADNIARGVQNDAKQGEKQSTISLIGQSLGTTASGYGMDTISMLSTYNRNGVFNTMNLYAVGALMNISF